MSKQTKPEQQFHFFGSTATDWCVGQSREEVLENLARMAGADFIKRNVKAHGGLYTWTCRVELPQSANYGIESYAPSGVPINNAREYQIISTTKWREKVSLTVPAADCKVLDPYGTHARAAAAAVPTPTHEEARRAVAGGAAPTWTKVES